MSHTVSRDTLAQTAQIHSTTWRQGTPDPPLQTPPHCLWIFLLSHMCSLELQHVLYCTGCSKKAALLVLGAFQSLLCLLATLCSPSSMHIYMTVSGPVCILLCIPVKSGEVYKKNSWSPVQAKVEIKRYFLFSLGWHSSKDSEMHYKYRWRSWHFYSRP